MRTISKKQAMGMAKSDKTRRGSDERESKGVSFSFGGTLLCMVAFLTNVAPMWNGSGSGEDFVVASGAATANRQIAGKCCPFDEFLSVEENFTCSYPKQEPDRRLYYSGGRHRAGSAVDTRSNDFEFSGCERDGEKLIITSLPSGEETNGEWPPFRAAPIACIELLWDKTIGRSIPIVCQCVVEANETALNTTATEGTTFNPLILANLRVCCRPNAIYDLKQRDCVYAKRHNDEVVADYVKILNGKFDFVSIVRGPPKCDHAIIDYAVNATRDLRVLDDGRLEMVLPSKDEGQGGPMTILANEDNSCIDVGDNGSRNRDILVVRICSGSKFCESNACVRKCCPEDEALMDNNCGKLASRALPGRFDERLVNASISAAATTTASEWIKTHPDYGLLIGKPCKYGMFPVNASEGWYLTSHGRFHLPSYRIYEHHEYCIDLFYEDNPRDPPESLTPFVCFDESSQYTEESSLRYWIFAFLQLTSCVFLILTLGVYACLPVLRNLHGKTLMCHVASLTVAYASLAVVGIATPSNAGDPNEGATHFCKFLGFTLLLSWIAAFTWLNVMCFDIWWTFGGLGGADISGRRRGGGRAAKKRFLLYSLYAWGFSVVTTISGIVVDHTQLLPVYLRPHVGTDSCWFERNVLYYGEIIFFIGPVTIQLVANVIFFVLTAVYCGKVKAEITRVMATPSDPQSKRFRANKTRLVMNLKLFVVMGVSWSLEVISAYLNHWAVSATLAWQTELFYASDVFNCLQGLLIFVLFGLKSKVYRALRERFLGRRDREEKRAATMAMTSWTGAMDGKRSGLRDPYRLKNSASSSTIVSASACSSSA